MLNCVQVEIIFFLADQIEISRGPKMVRGPDFGNHWPRGIVLLGGRKVMPGGT
jgi:hypothetical protein